jgi:hypothetical protein
MALKIPKGLKREFKEGFLEYLKVMGDSVILHLEPYRVDCPNCVWDSNAKVSTNKFNSSFIRPVNIFVGTPKVKKVYPIPFNITDDSGIEYDPVLSNPRVLKSAVCPMCLGRGVLEEENTHTIVALITTHNSMPGGGGTEGSNIIVLPAGEEGTQVTRIKSHPNHYAICRDAKYYTVKGIKMRNVIPPRLKGLGGEHITEAYLITVDVGKSSNTSKDGDYRLDTSPIGQSSNQAPESDPQNPPTTPGDTEW